MIKRCVGAVRKFLAPARPVHLGVPLALSGGMFASLCSPDFLPMESRERWTGVEADVTCERCALLIAQFGDDIDARAEAALRRAANAIET